MPASPSGEFSGALPIPRHEFNWWDVLESIDLIGQSLDRQFQVLNPGLKILPLALLLLGLELILVVPSSAEILVLDFVFLFAELTGIAIGPLQEKGGSRPAKCLPTGSRRPSKKCRKPPPTSQGADMMIAGRHTRCRHRHSSCETGPRRRVSSRQKW